MCPYSGEAHSITHPHSPAQIALMSRLLREANVSPADVSVVEAHGTGTQAGDLNEMRAIRSVFVDSTGSKRRRTPVTFTSSKANLGHSEAASGLTAVIKTTHMMLHRQVPRHIGIRSRLNPSLQGFLADGQVRVAQDGPVDLPHEEDIIACVNNFGASGGNTSVLMQSFPSAAAKGKAAEAENVCADIGQWPFIVSAKSSASLQANRQAIVNHLSRLTSRSGVTMSDLSYTSCARRLIHEHVDVHFASSITELKQAIKQSQSESKHRLYERPPLDIGDLMITTTPEACVEAMLSLASQSRSFRDSVRAAQSELSAHGGAVFELSRSSLLSNRDSVETWFVFCYSISAILTEWGVPSRSENRKKREGDTSVLSLALAAVSGAITLSEAVQRLGDAAKRGKLPSTQPQVTSSLTLNLIQAPNIAQALFQVLATAQAQLRRGRRIKWRQAHDLFNPKAKLVKIPNYRWDLKECYTDFQDTCLVTESWSDSPRRASSGDATRGAAPSSRKIGEDGSVKLVRAGDRDNEPTFRIEASTDQALDQYMIACGSRRYLDLSLLLAEACPVAFERHMTGMQLQGTPPLVTKETLSELVLSCSSDKSSATLEHRENRDQKLAEMQLQSEAFSSSDTFGAKHQAAMHLEDLQARRRRASVSSETSRVGGQLIRRTLAQKWCAGDDVGPIHSLRVTDEGKSALVRLNRDTAGHAPERSASMELILKAVQQCILFLGYQGSSETFALRSYKVRRNHAWQQQQQQQHQRINSTLRLADMYVCSSGHGRDQAHVFAEGHDNAVLVLYDIELVPIGGSGSTEQLPREKPASQAWAASAAVVARPSPGQSEAANGARSHTGSAETVKTVSNGSDKSALLGEATRIIAGEIGLEPAELIANDLCFADLGIDSLMSLTVLARLREVLTEVELPSSLFIDYDRWSELSVYLDALLSAVSDNSVSEPCCKSTASQSHSTSSSNTSASSCESSPVVSAYSTAGDMLAAIKEPLCLPESVESRDWPAIDDPAAKTVILAGKAKDGVTPLFLLPDGSGSAAVFQHVKGLNRLVYGLNSPFLLPKYKEAWKGGVEQIADHYVGQIRAKQPTGPYLIGGKHGLNLHNIFRHPLLMFRTCLPFALLLFSVSLLFLAGWSFGGVTSYAVAAQLVASGEQVSGIVLLDAPCPQAMPALPHTIIDWALESDALGGLGIKRFSESMASHFRTAIRALDHYLAPVDLKSGSVGPRQKIPVLLVTPTGGVQANAQEVPNSNSCVEWMFSTRQGLGCCGWDLLCGASAQVRMVEVSGNHFTMMNPPHVDDWLAAVDEWIRRDVEGTT